MIHARTLLRSAAILLAMFAAASCASKEAPPPPPAPVGAEGLLLGEVKTRKLKSDQCALVLLTREIPSVRVLIAVDKPAVANVRLGRQERTFRRSAQSGANVYGHAESQTWSDTAGASITADVVFETAAGVSRDDQRGALIRSATLSYTDRAGATLVIPVVGILSCGNTAG